MRGAVPDPTAELARDLVARYPGIREDTGRHMAELALKVAAEYPGSDPQAELTRMATVAAEAREPWALDFLQAVVRRLGPVYRATYEDAIRHEADPLAELRSRHGLSLAAAERLVATFRARVKGDCSSYT
jgi:hypothetical protein